MKIPKEETIDIIKQVVEMNDRLVAKIYTQIEQKSIPYNEYTSIVKKYRKKILRDFSKKRVEPYYSFFPILKLLDSNLEVDNGAENSIGSGEHVAFSALKENDNHSIKYDDKILWDLHNSDYTNSEIELKTYSKFLQQLMGQKELKELIETLGGTKQIENLGTSNFIEKEVQQLNVPSEFYSITNSNDISNMMYTELINLSDPDLEIIFLKKFVDNALTTYLLRKNEIHLIPNLLVSNTDERFRGAVVVALDTSGSMLGVVEIISKYLVILIAEICLPQKRDLVIFSYSVSEMYLELDFFEDIDIIRNKIHEFLHRSYYGGTDISSPIVEILDKIYSREELMYSDVLWISDFLFKEPKMEENTLQKFKAFKERGNRFIGIEVNTRNNRNKHISALMDEYFIYFFNWERKIDLNILNQEFKDTFWYDNKNEKNSFYGYLKKVM